MFVLLERMLEKSYFQYAFPLLARVCSRYTSKNIKKELMKRKSWRIFKKCIWNVFKMYLFSTYLICSCPYGGCVFIYNLYFSKLYECMIVWIFQKWMVFDQITQTFFTKYSYHMITYFWILFQITRHIDQFLNSNLYNRVIVMM